MRKCFYLSAFFVFILAALSGCGIFRSHCALCKDPLVFVHISDPQFGMYQAFKEVQGYEREITDGRNAANMITPLKPEFLVITGDLVEQWNNDEQLRLFEAFRKELESIAPVYVTAGNHDMPPTADGLAIFRRRYGPDRFTADHKGCRLIFLNSNLIAFADKLPDEAAEQRKWLQAALKQAAADRVERIFVFQHHPFFLTEPDEKDEYFNIPQSRRKGYMDLLADHGVTAVFTGHLHRESIREYRGMKMISTSSLGKPLGEAPPGIRVVIASKDDLVHEFMPTGIRKP
ncbi:MAG TPA: metallophosphoesterase [Candidatus Sumerlaeota bacterium]|nr:metallophosphoesterase [Candidatus Sumerlaeota bacterium]